MNKEESNLFSASIPHESAIKHVTGKAKYTDDIPEPKNLLYGSIGWSKISKGKILKIDLKEVLKSKGVKKVITYRDIPGINDVGPVFKGDPIFTEYNIEYFGIKDNTNKLLHLIENDINKIQSEYNYLIEKGP